jgi:hypothetical protein
VRHHRCTPRRRYPATRAVAGLLAFLFVLGLVTLVLKAVVVVLVGAVLFLGAAMTYGTWHTRRVKARPVPCRACKGVGLIDKLYDGTEGHETWALATALGGGPQVIALCLTCNGTGRFADNFEEAQRRVDG